MSVSISLVYEVISITFRGSRLEHGLLDSAVLFHCRSLVPFWRKNHLPLPNLLRRKMKNFPPQDYTAET